MKKNKKRRNKPLDENIEKAIIFLRYLNHEPKPESNQALSYNAIARILRIKVHTVRSAVLNFQKQELKQVHDFRLGSHADMVAEEKKKADDKKLRE